VERLISHRLPFTEAPAAYRLLLDRPAETMQVVLTYDDEQASSMPAPTPATDDD